MPRSPKKSSDSRKKRRRERNRRGLMLRANRSPDLSEADEALPDGTEPDSSPPPAPPATDVRSHWVRWGGLGAAAVAVGVAAGAVTSVQIGLITAVAVFLGGAAFFVMFFPPPVHSEGGDPAGLNFGRTNPESQAAEDAPPNRAARRAQRDRP